MMTLGEKILAVTKDRELDLAAVAKRAGLAYSTLLSYTQPSSIRMPSAPRGIALAKALGVSIDWLFDDKAGLPAVPYHEPPPFKITPWPPDLISWQELRKVALVTGILKAQHELRKIDYKPLLGFEITPHNAAHYLGDLEEEGGVHERTHALEHILNANQDLLQRLREMNAPLKG